MKNILFFITAIIFITGCGSSSSSPSSSSLPELTSEIAQAAGTGGSVLMFQNLSVEKVSKKAEQIASIKEETGLEVIEYQHSATNDCTALGYKRVHAEDIPGDGDTEPDIRIYNGIVGECIEFDFVSTKTTGNTGYTVLLK